MHNTKITGQKIVLFMILVVLGVSLFHTLQARIPNAFSIGGLGVALGAVAGLLVYDFWRDPAKESADPLVWDPEVVVRFATDALKTHDEAETKKMVMRKFVITEEETDDLVNTAIQRMTTPKHVN
ncbi:hypothetical protein [Lacticaseibacillus saniviri]|uniref:Uncharacterized protein n=1 Tax=Lacticaseibacillus saniviri JCM 17471 = DSM 24301 TaxID=1293598 RepID=A0A0R2MXR6_9LACO|nr:hypothetical protein [Lacticaseibacillus saniviri]KRO16403.1 hypothetical protein IV56_GL001185 [Lacticaseibacillus saniviri JCM 17471 = DSM 24301]MCG4282862.1 hypothetical protein [Lacticaseibacillus saniviri]